MPVSLNVESITFSDETEITLSRNDIVVLVGPNNSGKSEALRNVYNGFRQDNTGRGIVVKSIKFSRQGTDEEFSVWIENNFKQTSQDHEIYLRPGLGIHKANAIHLWHESNSELGKVAAWFCHFVVAEQRIASAQPAPNWDVDREPLACPIHYLYLSPQLEERVSNLFKQAFGVDIVLDRNAGNQIPFHVGKKPILNQGEERISKRYRTELNKLPSLQSQGDGMKSFLAGLLDILVYDHSVTLFDEPETFLHPPQARLLGKMLAKEKPKGKQILFATHSGDFLKGLLDANKENVRIIRISREDDVNNVTELEPRAVQELWGAPLLKYSNILDALFHEFTILCEGDADCKFYSAVLDALFEDRPEDKRPDLMFTHCGGTSRMETVINALKTLNVPMRVVVDFDILRKGQPLQNIFTGLGGDWHSISRKVENLRNAIEGAKRPNADRISNEIQGVLEKIGETNFPKSSARAIEKILKEASPWSEAKNSGKACLPSGQPTETFNQLARDMEKVGLYILDIGELERFCPSVGAHGPKWVNEVLSKNLLDDPDLDNARKSVHKLTLGL